MNRIMVQSVALLSEQEHVPRVYCTGCGIGLRDADFRCYDSTGAVYCHQACIRRNS